MRPRSQTIGTLGRAPARASTPPPVEPPPPPPSERGPVRGWLQSAMFDNTGLKFLSMVLAVTVFLLVNTDKDREITARVGVAYKLPEDKVLVSERVDEVRVTIKGAWRRLRKFDEREVERINLDLQHAPSGEIPLTSDMIHLPSGVTVTSINPRFISVVFDKRVEKIVEVTPAITGRPQHGYVAIEAKPIPATVRLRGGQGTLGALTSVHTREVSLEGRADSFVVETEAAPPEGIEVIGNPSIGVQVRVDEELVTRKVPGMTVVVRGDGDPARWKVMPAQVEISLTGALLAVEKARGSLVPVVKLTPDPHAAATGAPREVEVTIDGLPPGVGVKISPEHVKLAPVKQASPAAPQRSQ
jgi:YbbR domain-containing protein